jgi:uncharacterized OB-fold protein
MSERAFTHHNFQQYLNEGRLMGTRCESCGAVFLPPRPICLECHSSQMEWVEFSGKGKLTGFTIVHIAPTAMIEAGYGRDNPYCAGIVQLEDGPAISAQILGVDVNQPDEIVPGMALELSLVQRGEGENARTALAFKAS